MVGGDQAADLATLCSWRLRVASTRPTHAHPRILTYDLQNGYQSTSHDLTVSVKSCKFGFEECSVLARCLVYWLLDAGGRVLRLLNK